MTQDLTGSPYTLESVPAHLLTVDGGVQRALNPGRVRALARDFDETRMGVLVVSLREPVAIPGQGDAFRAASRYVVLDGQTRLAALRLFTGDPDTRYPVTCQVFRGLDRAQEAALFLGLNDRAAVRPVDKFRLALVAGEPWARDLGAVIDRHGFEANRGAPAARRFTAVVSARRVMSQEGGQEALDRACELLVRAWGHQSGTLSSESVEGVGLLYLRHGKDVDTVGFAARLARKDTPKTFKANTMAMRGALRLNRMESAYLYTLSVYNLGLRVSRLEPVETGK
jgi:hypothetical protein